MILTHTQTPINDIHATMASLKQQQADLQRVIDERLANGRADFIEDIRVRIADAGYNVSDIAEALIGTKKNGKSGEKNDAASIGKYPRYTEPGNPKNAYVRGPIPDWMKERMRELSLDPFSKSDREKFKSEHLVVV